MNNSTAKPAALPVMVTSRAGDLLTEPPMVLPPNLVPLKLNV